MANTPYQALLNCQHVMLYSPPPYPGDRLWCQMCTDYRYCLKVIKPWRMWCLACTVAHSYGTDESRIRRTAIRHLRLHPGHSVWIREGDEPAEEVGQDRQEPLPICDLQRGSDAVE